MSIRFALLGAGRIGRVHAQTLASNSQAQLIAVADFSATTAQQLIADFGGQVRSIEAIAAADDIDAVLICTPTNTHADLIEKFARAGKAIFCEKPIDLSSERVKACLKVVESTNTQLMVGFNRRFDPHFAALKQVIDSGQIGEVEMINIISRDPGVPPIDYVKVSGGIFKDMTIHDFDMARYLLSEEISTVMASASVLIDPAMEAAGDFDSANIILTTASGKQCAISNSRRAAYGYDQRIEVHGSLGMVSADNLREANIEVATANGYTKPPLHDFFMTRYTAAYAAEIEAFITALSTESKLEPSGTDGLQALAIAEAAMASVTQGQAIQL